MQSVSVVCVVTIHERRRQLCRTNVSFLVLLVAVLCVSGQNVSYKCIIPSTAGRRPVCVRTKYILIQKLGFLKNALMVYNLFFSVECTDETHAYWLLACSKGGKIVTKY